MATILISGCKTLRTLYYAIGLLWINANFNVFYAQFSFKKLLSFCVVHLYKLVNEDTKENCIIIQVSILINKHRKKVSELHERAIPSSVLLSSVNILQNRFTLGVKNIERK